MNTAECFVRCLENEGVTHVFGVPGEETEDLLFALEASSIQFVPCRHEQGAAFIANVWGRLTGRAGVCLATLGPGATNLVTGVADANLDKAPLVAVTGQGGRGRLHHESHQVLDVVGMFAPITKWNTAIAGPDVVGEVVRKAFKVAENEKPGATHVELSEDLAAASADDVRPLPRSGARRPVAPPDALEAAIAELDRARRPLLLAGNGAVRKPASRVLRSFVEHHGLPVVSTFMGKGALDDRSPHALMSVGTGFRDHVMDVFDRTDLVVAVGYDVAELAPERWNPGGDLRIVHVDFEPAEVYDAYTPCVELVGDVARTLEALDEACVATRFTCEQGWFEDVRRQVHEDLAHWRLAEGDPLTVPGVLHLLREALPDDGLLISDVGSHKVWIGRNFPTYVPGGCLISNGLASMGIAVPGGIAASLVDPERPTVAACGDGGFLMNVQELETAVRVGAAYTVLVFNDDDYGLISWKQQRGHGRSVHTRIGNPDFVRLGESFGIPSARPETAREMRAALQAAIASREMRIIEARIDTSVNEELARRLRPAGRSA